MDEVARIARERKPKLLLAGWSAYPRQLDFARFREIADEVGAILMVDMAHFAGLVAAGLHPNPVPHADVVTTTIHKTLGGAARRDDPLHARSTPRRSTRPCSPASRAGRSSTSSPARPSRCGSRRPRRSASASSARSTAPRPSPSELLDAGHGVNVLTGGTDVHLVLCDLRESELDGQQAEDRLHEIGITVNRNAVPFDPRPPMVSSGLRIGTPALATRGLGAEELREVGGIIATALTPEFESQRAELAERVARDRRPPPALRAAEDRRRGRLGAQGTTGGTWPPVLRSMLSAWPSVARAMSRVSAAIASVLRWTSNERCRMASVSRWTVSESRRVG